MIEPCGPNVVDGPLSWLSTGPVIFGQGFLATFASQSLEQSKSLLQISYPAFNGLTKAKRQSVFHRNLGGDVGRHRFPSPRTLTKMAPVPKGTGAIHLSYGAGDGKSKDLHRKSLFRCGPSALACCAGKCSRIFSAPHPGVFDSRHPARKRKRL